MRLEENFKFLKTEVMKRKVTEENPQGGEFLVIHMLDEENTPCRFFVFREELITKLRNQNFNGLQDILVSFELKFSNNNWNVNLIDID